MQDIFVEIPRFRPQSMKGRQLSVLWMRLTLSLHTKLIRDIS
jgi:hypothetical protein